ncbi:MAG: 2-oxo acid dehydrogenase subunit E2 [Bacteroidales bacterium]|jgi:pyruvate/2-oxoglutarate dehydrogenase complex dihydrolipoamide acyltransferase (E2) component|nr:2-oxo acid dehydrogenase subunit E2 [Bacteroidales bacterium]MDX9927394.1 2-oxo acid dehydrogenase subunit E2 [Bacteroidales bacterium]HNX84104.1 2-oxo acid dehydrogenase subunit E2 [Bacteroidales bacterium]HOC48672.1 2-oxo acid dehydrogenase subunit E2 [Bacteroidales bacterium]HPS98499.1 2-oxo acid dehydrogenase subunit E2 [Bacteroidales bacterium]
MTRNYYFQDIVRSRTATFDIFGVGLKKHHISAMLEFDVTESRSGLRELRKKGISISFNAWLIKVIGSVIAKHPEAAAYFYNKRKIIIFNDINVSLIVEKKIGDARVPIPLVIEKVNKKPAAEISEEIDAAKGRELSSGDIVLKKKSSAYERFYYRMPGFFRRFFWVVLLKRPKAAFRTMGNVSVTSVGMIGKVNGWFIHKSVHPISFGVGSVLMKPVVIGNEIKAREVLNMTVLVDHDVIDGAPMVRFLGDLTDFIENGKEMD